MIYAYIFGCGIGENFNEKNAKKGEEIINQAVKKLGLKEKTIVVVILVSSTVKVLGSSEKTQPFIDVVSPSNDEFTSVLITELRTNQEVFQIYH